MTIAVVNSGPSSPSSSVRHAAWSLSARSAVATSGPGIHDQHLIAPEPLGEHLIGLRGAPPRSGGAHSGEGQPAARHPSQLSRQQICCKLIGSLAAAGRLNGQRLGDGAIQVERHCHGSSVTAQERWPR